MFEKLIEKYTSEGKVAEALICVNIMKRKYPEKILAQKIRAMLSGKMSFCPEIFTVYRDMKLEEE
jgi:hypothetical protein